MAETKEIDKSTKATAAIAKGNKKCKLKNLFNVGLPTLKPPHSHSTIEGPTKGIAENKFVITTAAQ